MFDQVSGVTYNLIAMKNRVLLTMLIIFIVLAGVWITCGTVFVVREIDIVDASVATQSITDTEKDIIINECGLKGKNILFNLNQDKVTEKIKAIYPMLKLHSVTAKFPNQVILKISRRVPIYYDSENSLCFDAEMCVVEGTAPDCVDITDVGLKFAAPLKVGDMAKSKTAQTQAKINQLKILASYYPSLKDFKIAYDDADSTVGSEYICLLLTVAPNVTFRIKVRPNENFSRALAFTQQIYNQQNLKGTYRTIYDLNQSNKVVTEILDQNGNRIGDIYHEK